MFKKIIMNYRLLLTVVVLLMSFSISFGQRLMQPSGRGVVAVKRTGTSRTGDGGSGCLISWRKLAQDPEGTTYNIYKRPFGGSSYTKINSTPLSRTNYSVSSLENNTEYAVTSIYKNVESEKSIPFLYKSQSWDNVWFNFDFDNKVIVRNDYRTKFVWPMDSNGDGEIDAILVDRLFAGAGGSDDAEDGSDVTLTTTHKIQAYKLDGTLMWTVDMGPNVNICGGQNDMVVAYDINCDGKCEVLIRSSDGTRFWDKTNETWGKYVNGNNTGDSDGDGIIDYSGESTKLPPFYASIIDGETGAEIACNELNYSEVHDGSDTWTRNSRSKYMSFGYAVLEGHFSICYLDGIHPSLVMECQDRDTNKVHHTYVFSWDFDWTNGVPSNWHHSHTFTPSGKSPGYATFHQLRVADVDGDGLDEMCQGGYSVNPFKGTYHSPGIGHGDRFIISDINPSRPGMETYAIQQSALLGQVIYDASTGKRLKEWYLPSVYDVGRGSCMDIDPSHKGYEIYSFTDDYMYDCEGNPTGETRSQWNISTCFEGFWWNGDLLREELSSPGGSGYGTNMMVTTVRGKSRLIEFSRESGWGTMGATGTRPAFMGDIKGDWREEVILAHQNADSSTGLTGYTTNIPSNYSIYWLQQDPHYRGDCTTRGYYQHPNTSFYLGAEMPLPPLPPVMEADFRYKSGQWSLGSSSFTSYDQKSSLSYSDGKSVIFDLSGDNSSPIDIVGEVKPSSTYFINPLGHDYLFNGNISSGFVYKSQQGTVVLNGDITSKDSVIISEGTLALNGLISSPISLRSRGTLAGNVTIEGPIKFEGGLNHEGCRLSPGTSTSPYGIISFNNDLTLPGDVYLEFNLQTEGEVKHDQIKVNGNLTLNKANTLNIKTSESTPSVGEYTLVECSGTLTADLSKLNVIGLVGLNYTITNDGKKLVLVIRETRDASTGVYWTGVENGKWDYQTENFKLNDSPTSFVTNDEVVFDDNASSYTVELTDLMVTNGVHFMNETNRYTFNGDGGFSGSGNLVKDGSGGLVLNATKSDFTGKAILNGGTVSVVNMENSGIPSCLGAGSRIEIGKATLTINHTNAATNRLITLTDTATINIPTGNATFQSAISGSGVLVKKGGGQININYGGANSYSGTILNGGTLSQGAWNASIGKSGSPIHVTGNSSLTIFNNNSTSAVPSISNAITIDKGKTLTVNGGQRCKMEGSLKGEGTLKISFPYVRGDFSTNMSNFSGTLNPTSGQFRLTSGMNLEKGTFMVGAGVYAVGVKSQSGTETSMTHKIGALSSTASDAQLGTSVWNVGYLGTNTTFAGIVNSSATFNKYGEGTLSLTGSSSGAMTVFEGTLSLENSASATTTGLVKANNGGTVRGTGKCASVTISKGGKLGAGKSNSIAVGTLTMTGSLTVQNGGIVMVRGRGTGSTIDTYDVSGKISLTSPVFEMERLSNDWSEGVDYKVFTGTGSITLTGTPSFIPEVPKAGYKWDYSDLATNGILRVVLDPNAVSIDDVKSEPSKYVIYDSSGRRVSGISRHGTYIVNGVKMNY